MVKKEWNLCQNYDWIGHRTVQFPQFSAIVLQSWWKWSLKYVINRWQVFWYIKRQKHGSTQLVKNEYHSGCVLYSWWPDLEKWAMLGQQVSDVTHSRINSGEISRISLGCAQENLQVACGLQTNTGHISSAENSDTDRTNWLQNCSDIQLTYPWQCAITSASCNYLSAHLQNKQFALKFKFQRNASKFAILF